MSIDLLHISRMPVLTAVDHVIKFRSLIPLRSRNAENLCSALDKVFRVHNKAAIAIDPIHADDEFRSPMEKAADMTAPKLAHALRVKTQPAQQSLKRLSSSPLSLMLMKDVMS